MTSPFCQRLLLRAAAPACALAMAIPALADTSCDAVYRASLKSLQTPHHTYSVKTHSAEAMRRSDTFKRMTGKAMYAAQTESSEAIFDGKANYIQFRGKWMRSPMSQTDMIANAQDAQKTHADTCMFVGNQSVDGQNVIVYKVHSAESGTDGLVRILQSNGLLQGGMQTIEGEGIESRYDYSNFQAPAVGG